MKKAIFAALNLISLAAGAQTNDLAIRYKNYPTGVTNADTIYLDFVLKNNGPINLNTGDTLYFSSRVNGVFRGMNLSGTETPYVLSTDLSAGDSIVINPGFLVSSLVMDFLPGSSSAELCTVVWGQGIASVDLATATFPADTDPTNNVACVTYELPSAIGNTDINHIALSLYPNPANNGINFKFEKYGDYQITITDLSGKIIDTKNTNAHLYFSTSLLPAGIYLYSIMAQDGSAAVGKFTVNK